jgi:hypothetical protein
VPDAFNATVGWNPPFDAYGTADIGNMAVMAARPLVLIALRGGPRGGDVEWCNFDPDRPD